VVKPKSYKKKRLGQKLLQVLPAARHQNDRALPQCVL
jgi:hypothetical protein